MPQIIDSVGVELEIEDLIPDELPASVRQNWEFTNDRSCQVDIKKLSCGIAIKGNIEIFPYKSVVAGGEFVSNILDTTDDSFIVPIKDLTGYLLEGGESLESFRAGIHVHICFSNPNLRMLKSTIRLWKYLEDLFYLVGGMGYEFRGVKNDATYCRPLTKTGPIIVPVGAGIYAQSVNLDDLLESKTVNSFWERWGDFQNQGQQRYFPVRYHGFNLSPAFGRGTIEFRVFNKTLNPLYIVSVIKLCKSFAGFSLRSSFEDFTELAEQENSVYDQRSKDEIARTFLDYSNLVGLDELTVKEIMHIVERTPPVILDPKMIFSHLQGVNIHWQRTNYEPKVVDRLEVKKPNYIDLHVLRGER